MACLVKMADFFCHHVTGCFCGLLVCSILSSTCYKVIAFLAYIAVLRCINVLRGLEIYTLVPMLYLCRKGRTTYHYVPIIQLSMVETSSAIYIYTHTRTCVCVLIFTFCRLQQFREFFGKLHFNWKVTSNLIKERGMDRMCQIELITTY